MKKINLLILILLISNITKAQIPQDKLLHFGAGFAIGATVTISHKKVDIKYNYNQVIQKSVFAGAGIGLFKESYDAAINGNNYFNPGDAAATALGSLAGSLFIYSLTKNSKRKPKIKYYSCPQF